MVLGTSWELVAVAGSWFTPRHTAMRVRMAGGKPWHVFWHSRPSPAAEPRARIKGVFRSAIRIRAGALARKRGSERFDRGTSSEVEWSKKREQHHAPRSSSSEAASADCR